MLAALVPERLSRFLLRWVLFRAPEQAVLRLVWSGAGMVVVLAAGVVGYHLIEGFTPFDALYQTVLTVTTVGYQEVHPLSREARTFTIFVMTFGVGIALYLLTAIASLILEGDLQRDVEERRRRRMIEQLEGHTIYVGIGRMGQRLAEHSASIGNPFVVIESDDVAANEARARGWLVIQDDGESRDVLQRAGVGVAGTLYVLTGDDGSNVIITHRASRMAPDLRVVARANEPQNGELLQDVGASEVLSPIDLVVQHIIDAGSNGR